MRWRESRRSTNVENRRGLPVKTAAGGGGLFLMALIVFAMGGDPTNLVMEGLSRSTQPSYQSKLTPVEEEEQADFVAAALGETEDAWKKIFADSGKFYKEPMLILFSGTVDSACGRGQEAMGPFYCPLDQKVYLDLNFFYDLEHRHDSPGDFARAYVIAHEIGHHVQALNGTLEKSRGLERSMSKREANRISILTELQADCYAGIWAHHAEARKRLEPGDIDEALRAASQIGDDRLQEQAQGYVVPDSFTHGSSEQRFEWFQRGYKSGQLDDCDTFSQ